MNEKTNLERVETVLVELIEREASKPDITPKQIDAINGTAHMLLMIDETIRKRS